MDYSLLLAVEEVNQNSMANLIMSPVRNSSLKGNKLNDLNIKKVELSKSVEVTDLKSLDTTIKQKNSKNDSFL